MDPHYHEGFLVPEAVTALRSAPTFVQIREGMWVNPANIIAVFDTQYLNDVTCQITAIGGSTETISRSAAEVVAILNGEEA